MAILQEKATKSPTASVVIPTFGRPTLALSLAKQVYKFYPEAQIIIVDQEKTSQIDQNDIDKLNINLLNLKQPNTSWAKNMGIKIAKGEIVFFFDDDVEITENTISSHLNLYQDPSIAGVSGRVINDSELLQDDMNVETGKTNILGTKFLWQFWSTKRQFVHFAYGCNMSYRKSVLESVGGFDENFPKIFEEIDLGIRITRSGNKIVFNPKALVFHHKAPSGGTRTSEHNKMKMIYSHYGFYLAKNVPFPLSIFSLLLRTKTALVKSPWAVLDLYKNYIRFFYEKK